MREAVISKIPVILILGQNEVDNKLISYRLRGEEDTTTIDMDNFIKYLKERINNKN